jgi:hypothetical protein
MGEYDFRVRSVEVADPADYQARADQAKARKIELQQRQIELDQAKKAQALQVNQQNAARAAYQPQADNLGTVQAGGASIPMGTAYGPAQFNRGSYIQNLQQSDPLGAHQAEQQFQQQDFQHQQQMAQLNEGLAKASKEQLANLQTSLELQGRYFGAVDAADPKIQPQIYAQARQHAIQAGVPGAEQTPEQFDPQAWQVMKSQFMDVKQAADLANKNSELRSKTVQTADGVQQFNPATNKYDQNIGKLPKTVAPGVNISLSAAGGGLSNDAIDQNAQRYLQTGELPALGMGKDGAGMRKQILNRAAELGKGENIASNKASFGADKGSLQKVQGMLDAVEAYEGTAKKNLALFITQAKKVSDTGSPLLNKPLRAFDEKVLGDPNMSTYKTARMVALTEIARVVNNPNLTGVLSDSARNELAEFNPESATLAQTLKIATILNQDMDNRHEALKGQRDSIKGRLGGSKPTLTNQNQGGGFNWDAHPVIK